MKEDPTIEERFWSKVNKTDSCWLWTGGKDKNGYGQIRFMKKSRWAHRVALILAGIEINGIVRHSCDNPSCVNTDHLSIGTHQDNSDDKMKRDRHHGKLRNDQVIEIRSRTYTETSLKDFSKEFKVKENTLRAIMTGKTYTHLPGGKPLPPQKYPKTLSSDQIISIKKELEKPYWGQQKDLAKKYNTSRTDIYRVSSGYYD